MHDTIHVMHVFAFRPTCIYVRIIVCIHNHVINNINYVYRPIYVRAFVYVYVCRPM